MSGSWPDWKFFMPLAGWVLVEVLFFLGFTGCLRRHAILARGPFVEALASLVQRSSGANVAPELPYVRRALGDRWSLGRGERAAIRHHMQQLEASVVNLPLPSSAHEAEALPRVSECMTATAADLPLAAGATADVETSAALVQRVGTGPAGGMP